MQCRRLACVRCGVGELAHRPHALSHAHTDNTRTPRTQAQVNGMRLAHITFSWSGAAFAVRGALYGICARCVTRILIRRRRRRRRDRAAKVRLQPVASRRIRGLLNGRNAFVVRRRQDDDGGANVQCVSACVRCVRALRASRVIQFDKVRKLGETERIQSRAATDRRRTLSAFANPIKRPRVRWRVARLRVAWCGIRIYVYI